MRVILPVVLLAMTVCMVGCGGGQFSRSTGSRTNSFIWVKGNLHTHTTISDGDASPQVVANWYRDHGYQFLFITDHERRVDPASVGADGILLIGGEEMSIYGSAVHMNGLGIETQIVRKTGQSASAAMAANMDLVYSAGGLPMVNHPNLRYETSVEDLLSLGSPYLLEVYNVALDCNPEGDANHPSVEAMWDSVLSAGRNVYATASDDAHSYKTFDSAHNNPGRGWVVARVQELTETEVMSALRRGDFYASTGVELEDITFSKGTFSVVVKPREGESYVIRFIGNGGRLLSEVKAATKASYKVTSAEIGGYIRAKVITSDGHAAWTQPVRPK